MSLFEVKPYDREVYEKELKDFLPQKILDVHTHVWLDKYLDHKPLAHGQSGQLGKRRLAVDLAIPVTQKRFAEGRCLCHIVQCSAPLF